MIADNSNDNVVISLLVAAAENNVIGKDNALPWHLPNDLKYFKNLTWAMPVLMGRKTFESIGKALPGRMNIVITNNRDWTASGVTVVHSLPDAVQAGKAAAAKELFVIGGATIFNSALPQADRIYLTRIHSSFQGDTYFPSLEETEWKLQKEQFCDRDAKNAFDHTFQIWERRKTT